MKSTLSIDEHLWTTLKVLSSLVFLICFDSTVLDLAYEREREKGLLSSGQKADIQMRNKEIRK